MTIAVDGNPKAIQEIARVAFDREQVEIPQDTWDKMQLAANHRTHHIRKQQGVWNKHRIWEVC